MTVDYIIIGQGISGTWLSYYLLEANRKIVVFDDMAEAGTSSAAGGLINPVTGRRVVTTWMAETLLPFVWEAYQMLGKMLQATLIEQKNILVFPSAPDLLQAFRKRMEEGNGYIQPPGVPKEVLQDQFNFPFDVFEIAPCYVVQVRALLEGWRSYLKAKGVLNGQRFNEAELVLHENSVEYNGITAQKILYADGVAATQSRFWQNLPFVKNKGQALVISATGPNASFTYKSGQLSLVSLGNSLWWAGSSNELNFSTETPTETYRQQTMQQLAAVLKAPFSVQAHLAALRAATVERRPFAGLHPVFPQVGILNGMGSKGCSLAPWFARQLAQHLLHGTPVDPQAAVARFHKILTR